MPDKSISEMVADIQAGRGGPEVSELVAAMLAQEGRRPEMPLPRARRRVEDLGRQQHDAALLRGLPETFRPVDIPASVLERLVRDKDKKQDEPSAYGKFVERLRNPLGGLADKMREGIENDRFLTDQTRPLANMIPAFIEGATELQDEHGNPNVDVAFVGPLRGSVKAVKAAAKAADAKLGPALYDSLRPVKQFNEEVYQKARLYSGTPGKALQDIERVGEAVAPLKPRTVGESLANVKAKVTGEQTFGERAGEWIKLDRMQEAIRVLDEPSAKVAGMGTEEIEAAKSALESSFKPDQLKLVKQAQQRLTKVNNEVLKEARDAGLVSDRAYQTAIRRHASYAPLVAAGRAAEELSRSRLGRTLKPDNEFFQRLRGADEAYEVKNPIQATVDRVAAIRGSIEQNKILRLVTDLPSKDESYVGLVTPINTAEQVRKRAEIAGRITDSESRIAELTGQLKQSGKFTAGMVRRMEATQSEIADLGRQIADSLLTDFSRLTIKGQRRPELRTLAESIQKRRRKMAKQAESLLGGSGGHGSIAAELASTDIEIARFRRELGQYRRKPVPPGQKEISVYRDGLKETWSLPEAVHDALQGLNREQIDLVTKVAAQGSKALRAGATSLNAAFVPSNMVRDYWTASLNSSVGFVPMDWARGLASAVKKDAVYREFIKNGGGFSTFSEMRKSAPTASSMTDGRLLTAAKTVANPKELFAAVVEKAMYPAELTELAPRLGVFARAQRKGLSAEQAAFLGRDSTIDFAKAGNVGKVANLWVPFLNARIQGTANTFRAVRDRPARSALVLGGMVGLPTIATHAWNTANYPDIWDDIATYEKENNWLLIFGNGRDGRGNPTDVVKVPKGDIGRVFGNPVEAFLEYARRNKPQDFNEILAQTVSDLSPVGFVRDGKLDAGVAASQLLPPPAKVVVETAQGKSLFTGRDIVPQSMQKRSPAEQYRHDTPEWAVRVGKAAGVSPLLVMNAMGTQFGGLGRQIADPSKAGKTIAGRFVGARGGESEHKWMELAEKLEQGHYDEQASLQRGVAGAISKLDDQTKSVAQRRADLKSGLQETLAQSGAKGEYVGKRIEAELDRRSLNSVEHRLKHGNLPAGVREAVARSYLGSMKPAERKRRLEAWAASGVLSKALLKKLEAEVKK